MLEAVELPASIADLAAGLAHVDADALSLAKDNFFRIFLVDTIKYNSCSRINFRIVGPGKPLPREAAKAGN